MKKILLIASLFISTLSYGQIIRLSQIEPIKGTVIKSTGETANKILTTNGSGGAIWQAQLSIADYIQNQNDAAQPNSNLWISGQVKATSLISNRYDGGVGLDVNGGDLGPGSSIALFRDYNNNYVASIDGQGMITAKRFQSTIPTGTAPLTVASTTLVTNLNADLLDGQHGYYYQSAINGLGYVMANGTIISYEPNVVTNSGTSTDNYVTRFDGTTGKIIQNSNVTIDDNGIIYQPRYLRSGASKYSYFGNVQYNTDAAYMSYNTNWSPAGWSAGSGGGYFLRIDGSAFSFVKSATVTPPFASHTNLFTVSSAGVGVFTSTVQATTAKLTNLTDGFIPYHISSASGLSNSIIKQVSSRLLVGTTTDNTVDKLQVSGTVTHSDATLTTQSATLGQVQSAVSGLQPINGLGYVKANGATLSYDQNVITNVSTSTDNAIARFDGTTGKIIQNSTVIIDDDGNFKVGTYLSKITYGQSLSINLPAQGTRVAFLNVSPSSVIQVHISSSENGFYQPTTLIITRNSTGAVTSIHKESSYNHEHSNDIAFTYDASGNIYAEKVQYSTGRPFHLRKVEELVGTCTVLDGSLTTTGLGTDHSIIQVGENAIIINPNTMNVGIGVAPGEKLEVAGKTKTTSLQVTTGAFNGYFMKSDASGNGTWSDLSTIYEPKITAGTTFQYLKGNKTWGDLQTGNVPESFPNQYFTNTRAREAISLTTTGTSGAATYTPATGVFNIPNYTKTINGLPQLEGNLIVDGDWFPIYDTSTGTENKVLMSGLKTYLNIPAAYTLPLAANGTRGGLQIGYVSSDNDFALKISPLEKGYVSLPDASTTTRGIASFATSNFTTSYGYVTIKDAGITANNLTNGTVGYAKLSTYNAATDGASLTYSSGINALTWNVITGLPSQATHSGKYLTTNGTAASWATVSGNQWADHTYGIYYNTNGVGIGTTPGGIYELTVGGTWSLDVAGYADFGLEMTTNGVMGTYYDGDTFYANDYFNTPGWIRGAWYRLPYQTTNPIKVSGEGNLFTKTDKKIYYENYDGTVFDLTNVVQPFRSISANTTLATTDKIVFVTTGGITITYPTVPAGKVYTIRNTAATAITVPSFTKVGTSTAGTSIAGLSSFTMVYTGTAWFQID